MENYTITDNSDNSKKKKNSSRFLRLKYSGMLDPDW